jgi:hypothetical protein
MGSFGGYYKGERKKFSKAKLENRAIRTDKIRIIPHVEILGKKKKKS